MSLWIDWNKNCKIINLTIYSIPREFPSQNIWFRKQFHEFAVGEFPLWLWFPLVYVGYYRYERSRLCLHVCRLLASGSRFRWVLVGQLRGLSYISLLSLVVPRWVPVFSDVSVLVFVVWFYGVLFYHSPWFLSIWVCGGVVRVCVLWIGSWICF